jgi:ATP-dependent RNA helicase DDX3X
MSDIAAPTNGVTDEDKMALKDKELQENLAKLKEAGWTNPIPFNYETVKGGAVADDDTRDEVPWLANAAIYEWNDDFGDVAPPNPELEKILYQDEYRVMVGKKIEAFTFHVDVFGKETIHPVREVRP